MTSGRWERPSQTGTTTAEAPRPAEPRTVWESVVTWRDAADVEQSVRISASTPDELDTLVAALRVRHHQRPGYDETREFVTIDTRGIRRTVHRHGARNPDAARAELAALRAALRGEQ